jgi:hypothetical protein
MAESGLQCIKGLMRLATSQLWTWYDRVPDAPRKQLERFVHVHLDHWATPGSVARERQYSCLHGGTAFTFEQVQRGPWPRRTPSGRSRPPSPCCWERRQPRSPTSSSATTGRKAHRPHTRRDRARSDRPARVGIIGAPPERLVSSGQRCGVQVRSVGCCRISTQPSVH